MDPNDRLGAVGLGASIRNRGSGVRQGNHLGRVLEVVWQAVQAIPDYNILDLDNVLGMADGAADKIEGRAFYDNA